MPEVDWVVELVVYLEEGRELGHREVVYCVPLLELAQHEGGGVCLPVLL